MFHFSDEEKAECLNDYFAYTESTSNFILLDKLIFLGFWYLFHYQRKGTCSLSEEFFSNLPQRLILDFLWHCGHLSMCCVGGWGITFFI